MVNSNHAAYFAKYKSLVRVDVTGEEHATHPTLREAQAGAYWGVRSHFTIENNPAILVMPTGSGKTTVMTLLAFALVKRRTLIVAPSKVIRQQIEDEFKTLKNARTTRSLPSIRKLPAPKVKTLHTQLKTETEWKELEQFDVVISTPKCVSPLEANVFNSPPLDLFDVLFIDEAHHLPARTWEGLIHYFEQSAEMKVISFTATPYRQDKKLIPGSVVYSYPLSRAIEKGIYRRIDLVGIPAIGTSQHKDDLLAEKACELLKQDQSAKLLIRVDRVKETVRIQELYNSKGVSLEIVTSRHSRKHIRSALEKAKNDSQCHGLIAVGMLGEGLDLPILRIGVMHTSYKSIRMTIQFVGRLCRISGQQDQGKRAKLIAIPDDTTKEIRALYNTDSGWAKLVELAENAIEVERYRRRFANSEQEIQTDVVVPISLLRPFFSVCIFEIISDINLENHSFNDFLPKRVSTFQDIRLISQLRILISYHRNKPNWTTSDSLRETNYELSIYFQSGRFLFEMATSKAMAGALRKSFGEDKIRILPKVSIEQVLGQVDVETYYGWGMRRTGYANSTVPQYKMHYGKESEDTIRPSDGQYFSSGHVLARVKWENDSLVMGVSGDNGRVWAVTRDEVWKFIEWCDLIAGKLSADNPSRLPHLAHLKTSQSIQAFPENPYSIEFTEAFYYQLENNLSFEILGNEGWEKFSARDVSLLLSVVSWSETTPETCFFDLKVGEYNVPIKYDLSNSNLFLIQSDRQCVVRVPERNRLNEVSLDEYLLQFPPKLFLADGSAVVGNKWYPYEPLSYQLPADIFHHIDWGSFRTNIQIEDANMIRDAQRKADFLASNQRSVMDAMGMHLMQTYNSGVIFSDHHSGEIADYIVIQRPPNSTVEIHFFHCKASSQSNAGVRVDDVYEVLGQAQKSIRWIQKTSLFEEIKSRLENSDAILGSTTEFDQFIEGLSPMLAKYTLHIVQPGLSRKELDNRPSEETKPLRILLLSVYESLNSLNATFRVVCSQ